jgi:hypothetical protein
LMLRCSSSRPLRHHVTSSPRHFVTMEVTTPSSALQLYGFP